MQPLWHNWHIHIDVDTYCHDSCLYCSRYMRHHRADQRWFMPLDFFENALNSVAEFPNRIGLMGGEPTMHPEFDKICKIIQAQPYREEHGKYKGYLRYSLFTAGGKGFEKHKDIIYRTFQYVEVNEHNPFQKSICRHQPTTLAIGDMCPDKELQAQLIDDCWAQKTWCPNITMKGAFFCELAGSLDRLLDGPGGYEIKPNWWKLTPDQFKDQVDRYCHLCGFPLPVDREVMASPKERISRGLYNLFVEKNLTHIDPEKDFEIYEEPFTVEQINEFAKDWTPGVFRQDKEGC